MSRAAPPLDDSAARRAAATDLTRNLVVVAGAGTGKTSLLVDRALTAIGSGALPIDSLAAITFTEKAAGELRERLAVRLERLRASASSIGDDDPGSEPDRVFEVLREMGVRREAVAERALRALERLESAKIGTIHAFCSEILREHPLEARISPDFRVDRGEHARSIFDEEWERFLARELGAEAARPDLWTTVLSRASLSAVREAARGLAGFGIPREILRAAGPSARAALVEESRRTRRAIVALLERQRGMSGGPESFLLQAASALERLEGGGPEGLREALARDPALLSKPAPRANPRLSIPDDYRATARDVRAFLRLAAAIDDELCEDVLEALLPFVTSFRERLLERGLLSFDGLLALARDLLRDHVTVRESLKRRYRMILVDEFQDTDPLQYEIVLHLAEEEGQGSTDPYAGALAPGRLFVVGDPKQSIYRFRGADYSAFVAAVETIAPPEDHLHLVSNFRSVPPVLAAVNSLFLSPSVWASSPYQPDYEAIGSTRQAPEDGPRVEIWTVGATEALDARRRRDLEGESVAAGIEEMARSGSIRYRDVFVLMRAFTGLPHYLRPLRARNIPFVVDGGREFLERTEVVQLLSTLRTLAQPSDPVSLLAFLRSPAGAVPDTELDGYARTGGTWDWSEDVSREAFPTLSLAFARLRGLADETRDLPVDSIVRRVTSRTRLLPLAALGFEGAQRVANLRKLLASAAELARDGSLSFLETLEALQTQAAAELEGDSPLADEATDAVRIVTIHKAKGLENKVVFVPDLAREKNRGGRFAEAEARPTAVPGGEDALALRVGAVSNTPWVLHVRESARHEEAEDTRLLYVALTRARERLVLLAGASSGEAPAWIRALGAWGYDPALLPADGEILGGGLVRHRLAGGAVTAPLPEPELRGDLDSSVARYERAVGALAASARSPFASPSGMREALDRRRDLAEDEPAPALPGTPHDVARAAGIAMHRLLEHWDAASRTRLDRLRSFAHAAAEETRTEPADVVRESRKILEIFLASPLASRFAEIQVLGREVPMLFRDERGVTWRGSIDLLYRDADGTLVIADYKTDAEEAGDRYADQLAAYCRAVERAMGTPRVRAELWMLRRGEIVSASRGTSDDSVEKAETPQPSSSVKPPAQRRLF